MKSTELYYFQTLNAFTFKRCRSKFGNIRSVPCWCNCCTCIVCLHSGVLANQSVGARVYTSTSVQSGYDQNRFAVHFKKCFVLSKRCLDVCICHQQARKHILEIHTRDWSPKLAEPFIDELAEKCVGKIKGLYCERSNI